jgi:hypothetical protein
MKALKARGFRLSVDMQSFVWQVDDQTRVIRLGDIPEKQEILRPPGTSGHAGRLGKFRDGNNMF